MKKKLLTGMITAGLVLSMSVSAFATTPIKATIGFESSLTQESESTIENTIKDIESTIVSNPTIPKLKVTLIEALSTYTKLIENYNTAKTEVDRKAIIDELKNLINAIHEVIPDLDFTEYHNIVNNDTTNKKNTSVSVPKDIEDPFKKWIEAQPITISCGPQGTNFNVNNKSYFFNGLAVEEIQGGSVRSYWYETRIADFANALKNTEKKFSFTVNHSNKTVNIMKGGSYIPIGDENKIMKIKEIKGEYYTLYVDNKLTNIKVVYNPDMGVVSKSEALCSAIDAAYVYDMQEWILHDTPINVVTSKGYEGISPFVETGTSPTASDTVLKITANPTNSKVLVDGKEVSFDAYSINDNNYFKLRDVAQVVSGSEKRFEVIWDGTKNAINLASGQAYTVVGGELTKGDATAKNAESTNSTIYKDGIKISLTAYNINGNNYFKLRDLGQAFNFGVSWDSEKNTIVIDTTAGYIAA